jgi:predicted nucleic acid-binding protein
MSDQRVYWDSSVFHALFGREVGRVEGCKAIELAAQKGLVQIYTSTVTFVEVVWIKGKPDKFDPSHEAVLAAYFAHKYIRAVNCDRVMAEQARHLIWKYPHLRPQDAIHVATAISQQVDVLHTYDKGDLLKLNGKIGMPPLRIEEVPSLPPTMLAPNS